jgi:hypothetical protein
VFEKRLRIYRGVSAVVDAKAVLHSVVDAIRGMTYPAVKENPNKQAVVQLDEETVSPVAPFVAETDVTVPPLIPSELVATHLGVPFNTHSTCPVVPIGSRV